jgi:hypothetical protein
LTKVSVERPPARRLVAPFGMALAMRHSHIRETFLALVVLFD